MKILLTYSGLPNMRISFEENSHQHVFIWALFGTYQEVKALLSFFMIFSHQQVYFNYTFNRQTRVGSCHLLGRTIFEIAQPNWHYWLNTYLFCSYSIIHGGYQFPDMAEYEHPDNCQRNSSQSILSSMHSLLLSKVFY